MMKIEKFEGEENTKWAFGFIFSNTFIAVSFFKYFITIWEKNDQK